LTLEQLRIFVAVAERQHMTRAAEALNLTQSAVSSAVAALEERCAVPLFDRIGRRIELTEAGHVLLVEARGVLARAAAAERALADLTGLKRGHLTIQASQTIASYWLPRYLVRFHEAYPGVEIDLAIGNTAQVAKAVADGLADLGFVEGMVETTPVEARIVGHDRMLLVVSPRHAWAGRAAAPSLPELTSARWVMREPGSGTRSVLAHYLEAQGRALADLDIALTLPSNEALAAAVVAGAGATVLSELVVAGDIDAGRLAVVPLDLAERPFFVLSHAERYPGRAAAALLALVEGN
jgi:DNA-binding transcriptional LysR family regulator